MRNRKKKTVDMTQGNMIQRVIIQKDIMVLELMALTSMIGVQRKARTEIMKKLTTIETKAATEKRVIPELLLYL